MISYEKFKQIKDLQIIGKSQREVVRIVGLKLGHISRWWHKNEEEFFNLQKLEIPYMDNYRAFILDLLRTYPQIKQTNILYKLQEKFPEFTCKRNTFYRYIRMLREEHGLAQFAKRLTTVREQLPLGEEAQVDFGQFKMKTMYGTNVKVYFFCIVLSYSNFRFVYFQPHPFTTEAAIKAHNFAFKYFGGRTRKIMYDLDNVFAYSENFGDIIFVKAFEEYAKRIGFQVVFCKPRDPQTKGRVENLVGFVKQHFLQGRTYYGVDALNADCLRWLDTHGNELIGKLKYSPRELFRKESKQLIAVDGFETRTQQEIYHIDKSRNTVTFRGKMYELPRGTSLVLGYAQAKVDGSTLQIFNSETGELLCIHELKDNEKFVSKLPQEQISSVRVQALKIHFAGCEIFAKFASKMEAQLKRYFIRQCEAIGKAVRYYSKEQLRHAFQHCLRVGICNFTELMAFLTFKFGKDIPKKFLSKEKRGLYQRRAKELEVMYGK